MTARRVVGEPIDQRLEIRLTSELLARFECAAQKAGHQTIEAWTRVTLAAQAPILPPPIPMSPPPIVKPADRPLANAPTWTRATKSVQVKMQNIWDDHNDARRAAGLNPEPYDDRARGIAVMC